MSSTTFSLGHVTRTAGADPTRRCSEELLASYQEFIDQKQLSWTEHHRLIRPLGSGGQGVVYLSEQIGRAHV